MMEMFTQVTGKIIIIVGMVHSFIKMEILILENGFKVSRMVKEFITMSMMQRNLDLKGFGKMD